MKPLMRTIATVFAMLGVAIQAASGDALDQRPLAVDADKVEDCVARAVDYLYSKQDPTRGDWEEYGSYRECEQATNDRVAYSHYGYVTPEVVLSLLEAGQEPHEQKKLKQAIVRLAALETKGGFGCSRRASVMALLRQRSARGLSKRTVAGWFSPSAAWLVKAMSDAQDLPTGRLPLTYGTYSEMRTTYPGVVALRAVALAGWQVPAAHWEAVRRCMEGSQGEGGGWGRYETKRPKPEDCSALNSVRGLTCLTIAEEMLAADTLSDAAIRGMSFVDEKARDALGPGMSKPGFNEQLLAEFETLCHLCGKRTLSGFDWFEKGANFLIEKQRSDGGFSAPSYTAQALQFLARSRGPVLVNRLDAGSGCGTHPFGLLHLCDYIGDQVGHQVNWHVVSIDDPVVTWLDAPILFLSGRELPELSANQRQSLRLYTDSGGTVVAEACDSNPAFVKAFKALAGTQGSVWPEWEFDRVPAFHPVWSCEQTVRGSRFKMWHLDDGCRSCVFLLETDTSGAWNRNLRDKSRPCFQLGMNLVAYATDKRPLRTRFDYYKKPVLAELADQKKKAPKTETSLLDLFDDDPKAAKPPKAEAHVVVADWPTDGRRLTNVRGMRHLAELLKQWATVAVEWRELKDNRLDGLEKVQVVHMSGHGAFTVGDENRVRLQAFIKRGGLIWADAECGNERFNESFADFLKELLPDATLADVPQDDPLMTGKDLPRPGFDVRQVRYKQALAARRVKPRPVLKDLRRDGRRVVVYSPCDLTCGMDGCDSYGCRGPVRNDALKMAANILLLRVGR